MRTAGVTGFGGGTLTVQPLGGTTWSIPTPGKLDSGQQGLESFLNELWANRCYGATIVGTAAAANKAVAELLNPAASNRVLYIYSIDFFVPVAMAIVLVVDGTSLAPATVPSNLSGGGGAAQAKVGGGNQAATTGNVVYTSPTLAVNTDYPIPQPWMIQLPAGHNLQLQGQTVNQAFTCNIRWIEPSS